MSQENVEIVRAAVDAWNRGDWDATLKDGAPSFEFDFSRSVGPGRGVYSLDQMRGYFREFVEAWESLRLQVDEFIEARDHVVMPNTLHARGRAGSKSRLTVPGCGRSATGASRTSASTKSGRRPSKPSASRSKTLTPTKGPVFGVGTRQEPLDEDRHATPRGGNHCCRGNNMVGKPDVTFGNNEVPSIHRATTAAAVRGFG